MHLRFKYLILAFALVVCDHPVSGGRQYHNASLGAGAEIDGVTYMKYVRAVKTEDAITDACVSDDQDFHVVYAMGQLPNEYTHEPGSALETIGSENTVNPTFYQADELKFHGGGIGTTFAGRGILGEGTSLNLFEAPAASATTAEGGCTPSTLAPEFDCMVDALGDGSVMVHVKNFVEGDTGAVLAAETPSETGWVALGFHNGDGQMVGSSAVIATETAENGIGVFDLNAKAASGVNEANGATTLAARRRGLLQSTNIPITITDVRPALLPVMLCVCCSRVAAPTCCVLGVACFSQPAIGMSLKLLHLDAEN